MVARARIITRDEALKKQGEIDQQKKPMLPGSNGGANYWIAKRNANITLPTLAALSEEDTAGWLPMETAPRDRTPIMVKRLPSTSTKHGDEIEVYYAMPRGRATGYWTTAKGKMSVSEHRLIGWKPL